MPKYEVSASSKKHEKVMIENYVLNPVPRCTRSSFLHKGHIELEANRTLTATQAISLTASVLKRKSRIADWKETAVKKR